MSTRPNLSKIENALLNEPSIHEVVVRLREKENGQTSVVAYVVPVAAFAHEEESRIAAQLGLGLTPSAYFALSALPRTMDGQIDEDALRRIPVIDQELIASFKEKLLQLPCIAAAEVLVEPYRPDDLPLHVSDLLPENQFAVASETAKAIIPAVHEKVATKASISGKLSISDGGPLRDPDSIPATLPQALKRAANLTPPRGITYVQPDGSEFSQTYRELLQDAECILAGLRTLGLRAGDKVVFQLDRNQDFIPAFWACMLGGLVPAPISIAPTYKELNSTISKLHNCWELLGEPIILAGESLSSQGRSVAELLGIRNLRVASVEKLRKHEADHNWHQAAPDDVCLMLFTSGSTGLPKGVQQCHRSLMSRSAATAQMNRFNSDEVSLNWFPLDHVGGIVMFHLMDLFSCANQIQVPTELILQSPLKWLDLVDRHRATITWAPNFAFGLINDRGAEIAEQHWDLSSMRFILNGGEAIVAKTARRFLQLLQPHGLRADAMHPSWGMSETCSGVAFSERCRRHIISDDDPFVEVGAPIAGISFRIVDGKDQVIEEGRIGRLQVKGFPVTSGYYKNPELNRESFSADGWFNTGDLAVLNDGKLTITGRAKDVIIVNGVNFYSHEVEAIAEEVEDVEVSFTAACPVRVSGIDTDRLAVFFNTRRTEWPDLLDVMKRLRETLLRKAGVYAEYLIPVPQNEIPKTAIGKIQRTQLRERFEAGEFHDLLKQIDIHAGGANTVPDWFYRKVWVQREAALFPQLRNGTYLIFVDDAGLTDRLCSELAAIGTRCIRVEAGPAFQNPHADLFSIDPKSEKGYSQILDTLAKQDIRVDHIVHCWGYDHRSNDPSSIDELREVQYRGVYSLLFLTKALAGMQGTRRSMRLFAITNYAQSIAAGDRIRPEKGTLSGFLSACTSEMPWLECRHVDLGSSSADLDAANVLRELAVGKSKHEVAYRDGRRLSLSLSKVDMLREQTHPLPIKNSGLYLITGGLGGLGTELARYLATRHNARLILVGRTTLPDRSKWNETSGVVAKRITNYLAIEQAGADFMYRPVDISNIDDLQQCIQEAEARWGQKLDGVFHLAGDLDLKRHWDSMDEHLIIRETINNFESIFRSKLYGTWALFKLIEDHPQALFVSFSSVNAIFGGATFSAYSAANSGLDSFTLAHRSCSHSNAYCFNWAMWDEVGMSAGNPGYGRDSTRSMGFQIMPTQQGFNSMLAGLSRSQPQLVIGLDDNSPKLRPYFDALVRLQSQLAAYYVPANGTTRTSDLYPELAALARSSLNCRFIKLSEMPLDEQGNFDIALIEDRQYIAPETFAEPRNKTEAQVARVWREVLNISRVGIDQTFFELGGDSLAAIQMINRLRERLGVTLSVRALFEAPTVSQLSALLVEKVGEHKLPVPSDPNLQELNAVDLLARLDDLSDEQVDALLNQMSGERA
jgi:acyl-CoA synthetase (AMP-forming)/AMP-acid ligase II/NAD(P)-dependent dehydrogenase (short-subunit alcohol dehydrogenase family)/acyl carrier protein